MPHPIDLRTARIHAKEVLAGLAGINGIGLSWDDQGVPCLRVNLSPDAPKETRERIPQAVDGIAVEVMTIGPIHAE